MYHRETGKRKAGGEYGQLTVRGLLFCWTSERRQVMEQKRKNQRIVYRKYEHNVLSPILFADREYCTTRTALLRQHCRYSPRAAWNYLRLPVLENQGNTAAGIEGDMLIRPEPWWFLKRTLRFVFNSMKCTIRSADWVQFTGWKNWLFVIIVTQTPSCLVRNNHFGKYQFSYRFQRRRTQRSRRTG